MAQVRPSAGRSTSAHAFESKLSQQLSQPAPPELSGLSGESAARSPKSRSLSDASKPTSTTQPATGDLSRPPSKDDSALPSLPATPSRSSLHQSSLSLNLPPKASLSPSLLNHGPLSPKLDSSQIYGSPGSVLPRRSRGLDFSRACTNLHHSTLAESSPDSSPTVGGRGMMIPQRRGSPGLTSAPPFSTSGPADRTAISSSVSSVNMMESDTSSSDDDDDAMMGDRDDIMLNTPQAARMSGPSPFAGGSTQSPGNDWMGGYSQAAASLMSFQRARFRKGRSRHSSSSASGNSSKPSPGPQSPPVVKSVENPTAGYFAPRHSVHSRRESLSLGTRDLRLSDLSDDGEGRGVRAGSPTAASHSDGGPLGVIRRAVTRRGSLLPKTKTFARIRAALMEEGAPVDSDMKREAEVVRQVRDTEPETSPTLSTFPSRKPLEPADSSEIDPTFTAAKSTTASAPVSFSKQASRNSGGVEFWNSFDGRYRTPPPSRQAGASSAPDDDISMDMTPSTAIGSIAADSKQRSRSSTPHAPGTTAIVEICRKRRREDDFDPNLFKRRAVSPSVSAQSSPVLTHSSTVDTSVPNIWGPPSKLGPPFSERPSTENGNGNGNSTRNTPHAGTAKRVGLQGMTEASDGFMNMHIE
ncbi:hypothetical protein N7462_011041 [Penicillium macrosclerotiorum]|uniref:uncharacterized protein n=1 Tax=Penicillium macrosclerotiorum TaxID=303699 RepID=UPI0025487F15|nr:uncharacterized protein N7462_011041 [Penicillium macrosclerotiorum]KAJ5666632.1 hypothetical protein N7462_011041 [Penicillium macrosclerotiorum]